MTMELAELEKKIGINFKNKNLIEVALTHRSFLNENKDFYEHNERLEFLGDAVLELIVTEYLYLNFNNPEGDLTNWRSALVKRETLATVARETELNRFIKLSRGEEISGGREKDYILANTVEAFIGAVYLDLGYQITKEFVDKYLIHKLEKIIAEGLYIDAKSNFQEASQSAIGITPEYKLLKEDGPDHDKTFTVGLYLNNELISKGSGQSKQFAEQDAAKKGLIKKKWGKYKSA